VTRKIGLLEEHRRYRRASRRRAELAQALGLVAAAGPELGDEPAPTRFDQVGGASERASRIDRPQGTRQAPAHARQCLRRGHARHDGPMAKARIAGLVLTPGASAGREQSGLVAIDVAVSRTGVAVERVEFPGQIAGRRRTDPPAVCIRTVRAATEALADRLSVPTGRIAVGGRSFGGRMCSMAAADGLDVAALVLVSYPLHPPGRPERLRTEHFPALRLPCLFVSGRRDAFATPEELERETAAIPGPVTRVVVDGDHSLRKSEAEVAEIVATWVAGISLRV
jgi:predicted alpha/beta-hydrolase family hydrolase